MITERVMPIAMFLFFIMIGMNGFIAVSSNMVDQDGTTIYEHTKVGDQNGLGQEIKIYEGSITDANVVTNTTDPNADFAFDIWQVAEKITNGIASTVKTAVGVKGIEFADNMVNGTEKYMDYFAGEFPQFDAIFLSLKYLVIMVKLLVVFFAGSVLVRAIMGRRI